MLVIKGDVKFSVQGKSTTGYIATPETGGPGVLVLYSWWGLKPYFKQVCVQLAEQGYVAFAPDLYHNEKVAAEIKDATLLLEAADEADLEAVVLAAKDFLRKYPDTQRYKKIGVVGFSLGAGCALVLAAGVPNEVGAVALCYGYLPVDYQKIQAKVLGHFSDSDEYESLDAVRKLESDLKQASVETDFHIYPGCGHWFMETDRPEYNDQAADLAWERTYQFFDRILKNTPG